MTDAKKIYRVQKPLFDRVDAQVVGHWIIRAVHLGALTEGQADKVRNLYYNDNAGDTR